MWVQVLTVKQIRVKGKNKTVHPGDWVEVGKHDAMNWIADGSAVAAQERQVGELLVSGCGVVVCGSFENALHRLEPYSDGLEVAQSDRFELEYARTMFWHTEFDPVLELVPIGFNLLDRWEIAVPTRKFDVLALYVGSDEDREKTKAVIHDLRVPVYDTRLMFVKRTPDTRRLLELWQGESGNRDLAFLRAMYVVKPLVLALPPAWNAKIKWSVR